MEDADVLDHGGLSIRISGVPKQFEVYVDINRTAHQE